MKYIIFADKSVILFNESWDHKTMAAGRPVHSAGFCRFETKRNVFDDIVCENVCAYGMSISLGMHSQPGDDQAIKAAIGYI